MIKIQYAHITVTAVIGITFSHILALRAILSLYSLLSITIHFSHYFNPIFLIIFLIRFLTITPILIILRVYILAFLINGKRSVLLLRGRLMFIFKLKVYHLLA